RWQPSALREQTATSPHRRGRCARRNLKNSRSRVSPCRDGANANVHPFAPRTSAAARPEPARPHTPIFIHQSPPRRITRRPPLLRVGSHPSPSERYKLTNPQAQNAKSLHSGPWPVKQLSLIFNNSPRFASKN